jgi:hypothetical protein
MSRKFIPVLFLLLLISCVKNSDKSDGILKFYGDAYEDIGYSVSQATDGYLITGQYTQIFRTASTLGSYIDSTSKKMVVIKVNQDGNIIWETVLGGNLTASGTKVVALDDGTTVAAGYVNDPLTLKDIYVVKLDASGNVVKEKMFKSAGNQYSTDIIKTQEGFLILGTTDVKREPSTEATGNAAGKKDILLLSLDNNFNSAITIPAQGFIGNDEGVAIKQDINGGYIVVGTTDRSDKPPLVQAGNNLIMFRLNSDGSTTQPRIIGGLNNESASDFEVMSDGYMIVGTIGTEGTDQHGYVWKMPLNIYTEPDFEHEIDIDGSAATKSLFSLKAMCKYKTSSFLVAGQSGTGLSSRMLIFAMDAGGYMMEGQKKITGGTGSQSANDVISDTEENVTVIGSNSYENNSMISLLKFRF